MTSAFRCCLARAACSSASPEPRMRRTFPASRSAPSRRPWSGAPAACRAMSISCRRRSASSRRSPAEARRRQPADREPEEHNCGLAEARHRFAGGAGQADRRPEEESRRAAGEGCDACGEGRHEIANRHCERSEAIHPAAHAERWIASSLAPRNDGSGVVAPSTPPDTCPSHRDPVRSRARGPAARRHGHWRRRRCGRPTGRRGAS